MKIIKAFLLAVLLILPSISAKADLPGLPPNHGYFIVPTGECTTGIVEVGTYKPELNEFWTRTPKKFVSTCQLFTEEMFVGRYRMAVRCVDPAGEKLPSEWVRSLSGLNYPWPAECTHPCPCPCPES